MTMRQLKVPSRSGKHYYIKKRNSAFISKQMNRAVLKEFSDQKAQAKIMLVNNC